MAKRRGHGEGSITHRADGKYEARVERPRGPSGKRRRLKRVCANRAEATKALRELQRQVEDGTTHVDRDMTVAQWMDHWLDTIVERRVRHNKLRPKSREAYRASANHVRRHIGGVRLHALRITHLEALHDAMLDDGLMATTVGRAHACLRKALSDAVARDVILHNVAKQIAPPEPTKYDHQVPTPEQVADLLAAIHDLDHGIGFALAIVGGLRRGEACGLRWTDLDLDSDQPTMTVARQLVRVDGALIAQAPKGGTKPRVVHLPSSLASLLTEHRHRQRVVQMAAVAWTDSGHVLTTGTGSPVEPYALSKAWRDQRVDLGMSSGIRLHDLRHGAASIMLSAGVPYKVVSDLLGHRTIAITMDLYTHTLDDAARSGAAKMDAYLAALGSNA